VDDRRLPSADAVASLLAGGDLRARLDRWAAEARSDEAAAARARQRWMRQAASESATFAGVLLDLAERQTAVLVTCTSSRRHHGVVTIVGRDFCALRIGHQGAIRPGSDGGHDVLIAYRGLTSVRPNAADEGPLGDRAPGVDLTLAEVLVACAADRPRVLVVAGIGEGIAGELRAVGHDVVTVRPDGEPRAAYVALASIVEVSFV
jgi:hypothetical protein